MGTVIPVPGSAAATWKEGVADEASLPASGNSVYDVRVSLADETIFIWTGSAWAEVAGGGGGGGVDTVGAFSGSAQSNGASISGDTITFGPANATTPGMVSTGAQTWAGAKTFNVAPVMAALSASLPVVTDGSKNLASMSYATFLSNLGAAPTASPTFTGTVTLPSGTVTSSAWDTGTSTLTVNGVAFSAKAPLASPTFTGTVTLPSGTVSSSAWDTGTSTLTVNGVAFSAKAPSASPTFTGTVTLPSGSVTSSAWDTGTSTLTVNGVAFSSKAPLASPTFTGQVSVPLGGTTPSIIGVGTATAGFSFDSTTPAIVRNSRYAAQFSDAATYFCLPTGQAQYGWYFETNQLYVRGASGSDSRIKTKIGTTAFATGETFANVGGVRSKNTTSVGNVGTGEDDLQTLSLIGLSLGTAGEAVILESYGTFAANGNNKQVKAYFGSTVVADSGVVTINNGSWKIRAEIIRTGATTQIANGICWLSDGTHTITVSSPSQTLANATTVKMTGEATADNDIVSLLFKVNYEPAGN